MLCGSFLFRLLDVLATLVRIFVLLVLTDADELFRKKWSFLKSPLWKNWKKKEKRILAADAWQELVDAFHAAWGFPGTINVNFERC